MKHSRRRACAAYQEFNIRKEDEELIKRNIEEDTTLATRSNQSPTEALQLQEMIEVIKSEFSVKNSQKLEKLIKIRQEILIQITPAKLVTEKPQKTCKKSEPLSPTKTKKPKKVLKMKKPNMKSKSLKDAECLNPTSSVRTHRKSKASVLV